MTLPLVTLICTYSKRERGLEYLNSMITSVEMQDYPNLELMMVADCVDAEYFDAVDKLLGSSPVLHSRHLKFRHFQNSVKNRAATLNTALAEIKTDGWFGLLDSDDMLAHPQAISMMIQAGCGKDAGGVYSDRITVDADGNTGDTVRALAPHEYRWEKCLTGNYPFHLSLWRSQLLDGVSLDESLNRSADYDMVLQLLENYPVLAHVPEPLYAYRVHPDRNSASPDLQVIASTQLVRNSIKRMSSSHQVRLSWVVI
jgi:glycosyltransferase involved in cell wall biosynthesis